MNDTGINEKMWICQSIGCPVIFCFINLGSVNPPAVTDNKDAGSDWGYFLFFKDKVRNRNFGKKFQLGNAVKEGAEF